MRTYSKMLLLLTVVISCAAMGFAQVITGGYKKVSVTDAGVVAAADFAVETQAEKTEAGIEIAAIKKAERQSVGGTNYKLCVQVNIADGSTDEPYEQFANVIVYRSLKNVFELKSWTETEDCGA